MKTFKSTLLDILKEYRDNKQTFRCGSSQVVPEVAYNAISYLYVQGMLDGDMLECPTGIEGFRSANKKRVNNNAEGGVSIDPSVYGWYHISKGKIEVWWCWDNPCFKGKTFRQVLNEFGVVHLNSFDKVNKDHYTNKYCVGSALTIQLLVKLAIAINKSK